MEIQQLAFLKHVIRFNRRVYLDYNATTPVSSRVRRVMNRALQVHYGNPSSFYSPVSYTHLTLPTKRIV